MDHRPPNRCSINADERGSKQNWRSIAVSDSAELLVLVKYTCNDRQKLNGLQIERD
jgi:hypothetical protein